MYSLNAFMENMNFDTVDVLSDPYFRVILTLRLKYVDNFMGYIKICKKSNNPNNYISQGGVIAGLTPLFVEGLGVYILNEDEWFMTTAIQHIDWYNKEFTTKNSVYSFEVKGIEIPDYIIEYINQYNNESKNN